jgi:glycerophosphoryl diester phosphodiesterase
LNIAHMGASAEAPPNTLAAFRLAREHGADVIELDVTTTLDGVVVVSHDLTVDRCTDGHGAIAEMTLAQIKSLDAGIRFGERFRGEKIPTLEETIDWATNSRMRLCIEVKGDTLASYLRTARATVELLRRRNWLRWATLTSFNGACISAMKVLEPRLSWAYDPEQRPDYEPWEVCAEALGHSANFLLYRHDLLTEEILVEAHHHGFAVWTWTVNEPEEMARLAQLGVDGIMTDRPGLLASLLRA